ncbi:unnamed protein product [Echinostoma caproni]|uniref:G2/mitotic-specific cyclin-B3 n=1 Tax=Echinostoma caproni TaxID=27848 RepID=A0A183AY11_9TREM|nr:unnamed protein product [Echinostoma caproni]
MCGDDGDQTPQGFHTELHFQNKTAELLKHSDQLIQLDRLTLSDWVPENEASVRNRHELGDSGAGTAQSVHVIENTRLIAMMFHHPVAATLQSQTSVHRLTRMDSNATGVSDSPSLFSPDCGPFQRSYVLWLPQTPIDMAQFDEFHMHHERIFRYLYTRDLEATSYYKAEFLRRNGLSADIRATLCDWMIKVQQYLKLRTETLHLAVSLVDRYTWLQDRMNPSDYQLVGITALFVAAKFVERFAPTTTTLCYLTENSYKPKQVLEFELHLLQTLDFDVAIPLPHHFLTRAMLACDDLTYSERAKVELICCYLFELSLTEVSAVGVPASTRCAAAVRLVRQLLQVERERVTSSPNTSVWDTDSLGHGLEAWNDRMVRILGHDDNTHLRTIALIYVRALRRFQSGSAVPKQRFEAAFHKFSNRGYRSVAQCDTLQLCDYDSVEVALYQMNTSDQPLSM